MLQGVWRVTQVEYILSSRSYSVEACYTLTMSLFLPEGMGLWFEWHYSTREIGRWMHYHEPVRASDFVSIYQSPSYVMPFRSHIKCLLAFISDLHIRIQAKHTSHVFKNCYIMWMATCRDDVLMFTPVFRFELGARANRCTCCHW